MVNPIDAAQTAGPPVTVSVITVCLNAERHIRETIESVLGQTYPHVEYLVIDGGSTDSTLRIVRELEPHFGGRMRWQSEPDDGIYHAMNKGIELVTGDIIGILNADDLLAPGALDAVVATLNERPEADVAYGGTCNIDESGTVLRDRPAPASITREVMSAGMLISHQSMFVRSDTYRRLGLYDTRYRILADWAFVLRCIRAGVVFADTGVRLSAFREGGVSGAGGLVFDRELSSIRIAYGANPLREWSRHAKTVARVRTYRALARIPGAERAWLEHKARRARR